MRAQLCLGIATVAVLGLGCKTSSTSAVKDGEPVAAKGRLELCAAIRGNAHYLYGHFGALARIVEHYGTVDALAGGSSSTVTMFIYESIMKNPYLRKFEDGAERDQRIALLLKSFVGYLDFLVTTDEAMAVRTLVPLVTKAQADGIMGLPPDQYRQAAMALYALFSSKDAMGLVNPNIVTMLLDQDKLGFESYPYKVNEVKTAVTSLTAFKANDQGIFFREGLIDFAKLTEMLGRMGNFYAGGAPVDGPAMVEFLSECGEHDSRGQSWGAVAELTASGKTCGARFNSLVKNFRTAFIGNESKFHNRLDDTIGASVPTIVSTSVLTGTEGVEKYKQSLNNYRLNKTPMFDVPYTSIKYGYWIPARLKDSVQAAVAETFADDAKMKKFLNLGSQARWRDALMTSPAEPGLSNGVVMTGDKLSLGGWSDLHPVQILKAAGCEKVVYITREGAESKFLTQPEPLIPERPRAGVAEQLNMTEEDRSGIFDLANPKSSFSRAIGLADAVWCTDWNRFTDTQLREIFDEAYTARMVSKDPYFVAGEGAYPKRGDGRILGCSL